jgi:hypothetical protein
MYELEVKLPGFLTRRVAVKVYQRSLTFRIGLQVAVIDSSDRAVLIGIVVDAVSSSELWVRLVSLYNSDFVENAVAADGTFELSGMAAGPAVLLVFDKEKLVVIKALTILGNRQSVSVSLK